MPSLLPLAAQTTDAEVVDLCTTADIRATFPPNGSVIATIAKGRRYWHNQSAAKDTSSHESKKYAGPDSERSGPFVARHGTAKSSYRRRRSVVAALTRFGQPAPAHETGKILRNLADQGIFRLCSCAVDSIAYRTHGALLGVKLPSAIPQTGDLESAQPRAISVAIAKDDKTPEILDILQKIDPTFRAILDLFIANVTANYMLLLRPSERLRTARRLRTRLRAEPSPSPPARIYLRLVDALSTWNCCSKETLDQAVDLLECRFSSSQRMK